MLSTKLGLFCFVWQNERETQRGITCYDVMQNPFPFSFQLCFYKKTSKDLVEVSKLNVFSRPQGDLHVYTMSSQEEKFTSKSKVELVCRFNYYLVVLAKILFSVLKGTLKLFTKFQQFKEMIIIFKV